jgi:hypothetical protein
MPVAAGQGHPADSEDGEYEKREEGPVHGLHQVGWSGRASAADLRGSVRPSVGFTIRSCILECVKQYGATSRHSAQAILAVKVVKG